MSATPCRNLERKDFYENREADTGYRKESVMTRAEFRRRTFEFGIRCIRLAESLPKTTVARIIANQLIRAATSVGANYRAAIRSRSRADFVAKMGIIEEECDETLYWIDVLVELGLLPEKRTSALQQEANEILAVTVSSIKTARKHQKI
jgi:TIGR02436 family protein